MITINDFKIIDSESRQKRPKIFLLSESEPKPTKKEIEALEEILSCRLPSSYKDFISAFGGGDYGLTCIFSVLPSSKWYILNKHECLPIDVRKNYIPFSDDGCGGFFLFKKQSESYLEAVHYWNVDGELAVRPYKNLFEYLLEFAF
jgi:hypothetical protein